MGTQSINFVTGDGSSQTGNEIVEVRDKLDALVSQFNALSSDQTKNAVLINSTKLNFNKVKEDSTLNKALIHEIRDELAKVKVDSTANKLLIHEIRDEFGKVKVDSTANKVMIDAAKVDLDALSEKIGIVSNYTAGNAGGGEENDDPILKRLNQLDGDIDAIDLKLKTHMTAKIDAVFVGAGNSDHTGAAGSFARTSAAVSGIGLKDIVATSNTVTGSAQDTSTAVTTNAEDTSTAVTTDAQDTAATITAADTTDSSSGVNATSGVTGNYESSAVNILTIGTVGEKRAKKLTRKTLSKLRN